MSKAIAVRVTKFVLGVLLLVPAVGAAYLSVLALPSSWGLVGLVVSVAFGACFPGVILAEAITGTHISGLQDHPAGALGEDWTNTTGDWSRRADRYGNPASPFYYGRHNGLN